MSRSAVLFPSGQMKSASRDAREQGGGQRSGRPVATRFWWQFQGASAGEFARIHRLDHHVHHTWLLLTQPPSWTDTPACIRTQTHKPALGCQPGTRGRGRGLLARAWLPRSLLWNRGSLPWNRRSTSWRWRRLGGVGGTRTGANGCRTTCCASATPWGLFRTRGYEAVPDRSGIGSASISPRWR